MFEDKRTPIGLHPWDNFALEKVHVDICVHFFVDMLKKCGGMMSPSLEITLKSITEAAFLLRIAGMTFEASSLIHRSFLPFDDPVNSEYLLIREEADSTRRRRFQHKMVAALKAKMLHSRPISHKMLDSTCSRAVAKALLMVL